MCKHKNGLFLYYNATASRKEVGYIVRFCKSTTVDRKQRLYLHNN
ncbi:hypothetical protein JCM17042A_22480 [Ruminococcus champanellensis 18P13 = JCM 17042]